MAVSRLEGARFEIGEKTVHECFFKAVRKNPLRATDCGLFAQNRFTSYASIRSSVNVLANRLTRILPHVVSLRPIPVVALDIDPGPELVVAILAVVRCGYAYLPLDPILPEERIKFILDGVKPSLMIVNSRDGHTWHEERVNCANTVKIDINNLMLKSELGDLPPTDLDTNQEVWTNPVLAVQYTSGSTGKPKGVLIKHASLLNRVIWQWKEFPWKEHEVACFKISVLFVDSVVELFSAVLALVPLVIAPREMVVHIERFVELLEQYEVSRLIFVPSFLRNILAFIALGHPRRRLEKLDLWISNSETLPPKVLQNFQEIFPDKKFAIFYGSTETMADVTYERYDSKLEFIQNCNDSRLSLGQPMYNSTVYVLNSDMEIVTEGEIGEICVSGIQVAEGYLDPDCGVRYNDDFAPNPFVADHDSAHAMLYKTGDYGKILGGKLYFYGRHDSQFKVHGHRIDPCEIEHVISSMDGINRVVVLCHNINEYMPIVAAYYTPLHSSDVTSSDVTKHCKRYLPSYMIPKPVKIHDIPLQPQSGKTDRLALKKFFDRARLSESKLSRDLDSLDDSSVDILRVVADVCNLPETSVSLSVSFEHLGGNSVSAIECISRLRKEGYYVSIDDFMSSRSIRELISKCEPTDCFSPGLSMESKYRIVELGLSSRNEDFIDMFTRAFVEKEPLTTCLGLRYDEFHPSAVSVCHLAEDTPSVLVIRKADGRLVGADILTDFDKDDDTYWHPRSEPIKHLLMETERKARQMTGPGLLRHSILCVETRLPQVEQLKLVLFMEEEVLNVAKRLGFKGVIGCNTNRVTQNICEHFLGYQVLFAIDIHQYTVNQRRPFSNAPVGCSLKMLVKYV